MRKAAPFLVLVLVIATTAVAYLRYPLSYNQCIYHYFGLVLKDGGVPYRDFMDIKGPLGLLGYGLAAVLFGPSDGAYRLFDLIICAGLFVTLFKYLNGYQPAWVALLGATLWFLHAVMDGPDDTGDVTNLIVWGSVLILYCGRGATAPKTIGVGLLLAATSWVKPTALLILLPYTVYYVFFAERMTGTHFLRKPLLVLAGFLAFSSVMILYLAYNRAFIPFIEAVILDPLTVHVPSLEESRHRLWPYFKEWVKFDRFFRLGGFLGLFLIPSSPKESLLPVRLLVLGGSLAIMLEGRYWAYHFSILLPFLAIGCINGLVRLGQGWLRVLGALLLACLFLPPLARLAGQWPWIAKSYADRAALANLYLSEDFRALYLQRFAAVRVLKAGHAENQPLMVLGSDLGIYLELNSKCPSRFANPGFYLARTEKATSALRQKWADEILTFMEDRPPTFLVMEKMVVASMEERVQQRWSAVVDRHYRLIGATENYDIFRTVKE